MKDTTRETILEILKEKINEMEEYENNPYRPRDLPGDFSEREKRRELIENLIKIFK